MLNIHNVNFEPNEMPGLLHWDEMPHLLDHYPASIQLWEGEPIAEINLTG